MTSLREAIEAAATASTFDKREVADGALVGHLGPLQRRLTPQALRALNEAFHAEYAAAHFWAQRRMVAMLYWRAGALRHEASALALANPRQHVSLQELLQGRNVRRADPPAWVTANQRAQTMFFEASACESAAKVLWNVLRTSAVQAACTPRE